MGHDEPGHPAPTSRVAVLLKYVDLKLSVDPLTGAVEPDSHGGLSGADECALELALQMAEACGTTVLAATAGPPLSDAILLEAIQVGAAEAVRVDAAHGADSADVAGALSEILTGCDWVWCGDFSLDRGSGSVPAYVAGALGSAQALGISALTLPETGADQGDGARGPTLRMERRLDGGRREILHVAPPAVVSVESGIAPLRRPALDAMLTARSVPIRVIGGARRALTGDGGAPEPRTRPFRPRPRVLEGPDASLSPRERMVILSGALTNRDPPRIVHPGDAAEAADELIGFLRSRGYLDTDSGD